MGKIPYKFKISMLLQLIVQSPRDAEAIGARLV